MQVVFEAEMRHLVKIDRLEAGQRGPDYRIVGCRGLQADIPEIRAEIWVVSKTNKFAPPRS